MSELFDNNDKNLEDNPEESESYRLVYETRKKRPVNLRKKITSLIWAAVLAAVFGIIAAVVIARLVPVLSPKEKLPEVIITTDSSLESLVTPTPTPTRTPSVTPTPTPSPDEEDSMEEDPDKEDTKPDVLEQGSEYYSKLQNIAREAKKAMVTVTGVTTTEDWFNNVNENHSRQSGIIIADNGVRFMILVDGGIIENAQRISVSFYDGTFADASLIKEDPATKLAVIAVDRANITADTLQELNVATLGLASGISSGDPVIAVGTPTGYEDSMTFGQISTAADPVSLTDRSYNLIVTSMQGSSSGSGALLNLDGKFIGIITQRYSSLNGGNVITGLSFSGLSGLIQTLSNNNPIAYFGVVAQDVSAELSAASGMPEGIYVTEVVQDSPAFAAGIQKGDFIVSIDGEPLNSVQQLMNRLTSDKAGTVMKVSVKRSNVNDYADMEFDVTLGGL